MKEITPIKNWEDLYGITKDGDIWSYSKRRYITIQTTKNGYQFVSLYRNGKCSGRFIHRLIFETFVRQLKPNEEVNHINHIRNDNRIENLQALDKTIHKRMHNIQSGKRPTFKGHKHTEEWKIKQKQRKLKMWENRKEQLLQHK